LELYCEGVLSCANELNLIYITTSVKELFKTLKVDALSHLQYKIQKPWIESLDEKYYEFAGNYHRLPWYNLPKTDRSAYQFEVTREGIETKMAPPCPETSTPTFFTAEDYSKHLIGLVRQNCSIELHIPCF
jgi:hypothetical protein